MSTAEKTTAVKPKAKAKAKPNKVKVHPAGSTPFGPVAPVGPPPPTPEQVEEQVEFAEGVARGETLATSILAAHRRYRDADCDDQQLWEAVVDLAFQADAEDISVDVIFGLLSAVFPVSEYPRMELDPARAELIAAGS